MATSELWPELPLADWKPTYETLHMYTQIVGKIRLALCPMMNHWWQVPLYLSARGLTTGPMPYDSRTFDMAFDFLDHRLVIRTSEGMVRSLPLEGAVQDFYREVMRTLHELAIDVRIWTTPVEVPAPIPFERDDRHATYEASFVDRYWRILRQVDTILKEFRAPFTGKCSPVHFFWGSFDLAVTRFSGCPAAPRPEADRITRLAYNAELSSVGFWPGGDWLGSTIDGAALYSYAYPNPPGFADQAVRPEEAYYHPQLGEFFLEYDVVRRASDPRSVILEFAQSTFEAGARLQGWPLDELTAQAEKVGPVSLLRSAGHVSEEAASKAPNPSDA